MSRIRRSPSGPETDVADYPNRVVVSGLEDLPAPVGDVITLEGTKCYVINQVVDISPNRIEVPPGAVLTGSNIFRDVLTSDTVGNLVSYVGAHAFTAMQNLTISCPNGRALSVGSSVAVFLLEQMVLLGTNICSFEGGRFLASFSSFRGRAFEFVGTGKDVLRATQCSFVQTAGATTPLMDLGSSEWTTIQIVETNFTPIGGQACLGGLASSGNLPAVDSRGVVSDCVFRDTALSGIMPQDLKYEFSDNIGVADTKENGSYSMTGNATETVIAITSTFVKVAGVTIAGLENRFTETTDNQLTFDGLDSNDFRVDVSLGALCASGSKLAQFQIRLDGVPEGGSSSLDVNSNRIRTVSFFHVIEGLANGSNIEIWCTNADDTVNLIVEELEVLVSRI